MNSIRLRQLVTVMAAGGLLAACDRGPEQPANSQPQGMPAPPSSPSAPPPGAMPPATPPTDTAPSGSGSGTGTGTDSGSGLGPGPGMDSGTGPGGGGGTTGTGSTPHDPDTVPGANPGAGPNEDLPVKPNSSSGVWRAIQAAAWDAGADRRAQHQGAAAVVLASAERPSAWALAFGERTDDWAR